ncbi:MAG TPA: hypothetical protein VFP72_00565 [Kineosporiaceae bacterium]|nr:hypothetical protein [Kineosporiaceae bacterium]
MRAFFTENTPLFGLVLAVLTPLVTAVAQQPRWTSRTRSIVGALVSLVVGFLTVATAGKLGDTSTLLTTLALVVAAAEASYQKLWRGTGLTQMIENATSPRQVKPLRF